MRYRVLNKTRPKGSWRAYDGNGGLQIPVAGTKHHFSVALDFAYGARLADRRDLVFFLKIKREPDCVYDKNALVVFAYWVEPGFWILKKQKNRSGKLGYIPKELAAMVAQFPMDMPLAAELNYLKTDSSNIEFYINLLIPGLKSGYWDEKQNPWK